jgi:hypothetical protein
MGYAVTKVPYESPVETALDLAGADARDEPDPELLALPGPPRGQRTLTVTLLGMALFASLAMAFSLRHDVVYALAGGVPASLGDLRTVSRSTLDASENHLVVADARLGAVGGIRYERPFVDDTFRTLPVAGRPEVWVDVRVPAGQEGGRWEPPPSVSGRLVRLDAAGQRHRGLREAIERTTRERVVDGAWLVVDGETPEAARWAVLLCATFLAFAAWNAVAIARITSRVK